MSNIVYKKILEAYMKHVGDEEGTCFVHGRLPLAQLSAEENQALEDVFNNLPKETIHSATSRAVFRR